jgi:N-acetylneuraminic acid mutarotase
VLVVGGYNDVTGYLSSAELYDPLTGNWSPTGSLTTGREYHTATLLPDGTVLVAGGTTSGGITTTAEVYDPGTGQWTPTGPLSTGGLTAHTATLLPNGLVLVCGGATGNGTITAIAELYDPVAKTWAPARPLAAYRQFHTATLLPNGLVMVSGGYGAVGLAAGSLNSVEIYDPANAFMVYGGSWTSNPGSLTTSRMFHAATLMNNGEVLITGGESGTGLIGSSSFLPNAELFY